MIKKPVYLDYQATTPVDPRVFDKMRPYFTEEFGNAGSKIHEYGHRAERAVEAAREVICDFFGADRPSEIVFTSGATESNNLALLGITKQLRRLEKTHVITSMIEHKSVLNVAGELENQGFEVTYLKPNGEGIITPEQVEAAIRPETGLISLMHANNEIGVVYDIAAIGGVARHRGIFFHCDAAQSLGRIPINVQGMDVHLLSVSAHKIYGPKGIGMLYVRKEEPSIELCPILFGGGQEGGLRSGTLPVALIVGFGEAVRIASEEMDQENRRLGALRDRLLQGLQQRCSNAMVNGTMGSRLPHNLNISFAGIDAENLLMTLRPEIAVSSVSTCGSALWTPSHVLKAMGIEKERARSAIRFGLGRFTTEEEIDFVIDVVSETVNRLKKFAV